jgi:hypothetical protein
MVDVKQAVSKARGYLEDMAQTGDLRSMRSRKGE